MPRHGQWVTFALAIEGAQQTKDGRSVGIYQAAYTDARGEQSPEHVAVVRPDGRDLMRIDESGDKLTRVALDPQDCPDLQPLLDKSLIPRTTAEGWEPQP